MKEERHHGISSLSLPLVILTLFILSACSTSKPEIVQVRYQMNAVENRDLNTRYEQLTFFVHVMDDDGINDIETLNIMHEDSGLYWKLTPDTWEALEQGGETWIGSNGITMADYSAFPEGAYTVQLVDLAGFSSETSFSLSPTDLPLNSLEFPSISFKEDMVILNAKEAVVALLYSRQNEFIATQPLKAGNNLLEDVTDRRRGSNVQSLTLYRYNRDFGYALISGPYYIPESIPASE